MNKLFNEIFKQFWETGQYLIQPMIECDHGYNGELNKWHMEGSVWIHTCMAYNNLRYVVNNGEYDNPFYTKLLLATLLHDTGKPANKEVVTFDSGETVNRFKGHAQTSAQLAFTYLYNHKDFYGLSDNDIIEIVIAITYHDIYYQLKYIKKLYSYLNYSEKLIQMYSFLTKADHDGQIRMPDNIDQNEHDLLNVDYDFDDSIFTNKTLYLMVGIPASGKDTIIGNNYSDCVSVGYDDLRIKLYKENIMSWEILSYDNLYKNAYQWCNDNKINIRQVLHDTVKDLFNSGVKRVIINNTNVSGKVRKYFKGLARECHATFNCICVMTTPVNAIDRNINRSNEFENGKTIPNNVITNMWKRFTIPTKKEGFHKIDYYIT